MAEAGSRLAASLPPGSAGGVQEDSKDRVPAGQGNAGAAGKAKADIAAGLDILDGGLAGRPFLLGGYSLADTHVCSVVGWLGMMGADMEPFANLAGWMRRCGGRPAIAEMMAG